MKPIINHKEHCKLRIRNADKSFHKHEVVKLLIMLISRQKHKSAGVYSEWNLSNGDIPDVAIDFGDSLVLYEVQKEISKEWVESIKNRDLDLGVDTIVIKLKELSDDLNILTRELEVLIV